MLKVQICVLESINSCTALMPLTFPLDGSSVTCVLISITYMIAGEDRADVTVV